MSRRNVVTAAAWTLPAVAVALSVPARSSSLAACPDTSRWYLRFTPETGYGLDPVSYAQLSTWAEDNGVPLPTTATFRYEYVNEGFFWTTESVPGLTPDEFGYTRVLYDASIAPATRTLVFSGGNLIGSLAMMEEMWAASQGLQDARTAELPVLASGEWTRQGNNVYGDSLATLAFGDCSASFNQWAPPPLPEP